MTGEPLLVDVVETVIGEPDVIALQPTLSATESPLTPIAVSTAPTVPTTLVAATAEVSDAGNATPEIALLAMLDQPVDEAESESRTGALSGASFALTPTASTGGALLERLSAMSSAHSATAEAAATSAPSDTPLATADDSIPEMQPAPALAPPSTSALGAERELVWDGVERTLNVPILMYHYLSEPPTGADAIRRDLSVSPQRFAEHLDRMLEEGYTTISLYTLIDALATGAALPEKPVVITFDDGYRDNYVNAFPALRERGMTATFFVVTDFIDEERPAYVSWDQVREMLAAGMSIESHGRNHATLEGRKDDYLVWQALGSLETLQYELGVRPRFVSYPAGDYDANTIRIFASAGYWAGVTTVPGNTESSRDPFEMQRVRIHSTTTANQLSVLLTMDWD